MIDQSSIYLKPFWVVNSDDFFVAAFDENTAAIENAYARNERAK